MNIHMDQNFLNAKARGIEAPYAVGFMPFDEKDGRIVLKNINRDQLAQDAALSTQPHVGAPAALYTYVDPRIIDVLFGVTNATKFFDKTLVGSFTQDYATFSVEEVAGRLGLMKMDQSQLTYIRLDSDSVLVRRESAVHQWTDFLHDGAMTILASVRSVK